MTKREIQTQLFSLHHSTFRNYNQVKESKKCGCFHCGNTFSPDEIDEWCDSDGRGDMTAICPYCGIDSVLGDAAGVEITKEVLGVMNYAFFGPGIDNLDFDDEDNNESSNNESK